MRWRLLIAGLVVCLTGAWLGEFAVESLHASADHLYAVDLRGAQWVGTTVPGPRAYYRLDLSLSSVPDSATLWIDAEQGFTAYTNGLLSGTDSSQAHSGSPPVVTPIDITRSLSTGDNAVVIQVTNWNNQPATMRTRLTLVNGGVATDYLTGHAHWLGTTDVSLVKFPTDYRLPKFSAAAFDDGQWPPVQLSSPVRASAVTAVPEQVMQAPLAAQVVAGPHLSGDIIATVALDLPEDPTDAWFRIIAPGNYVLLLDGDVLIVRNNPPPNHLHLFNLGPFLHQGHNVLAIHVVGSPVATLYADADIQMPSGALTVATGRSWNVSDAASTQAPTASSPGTSLGTPAQALPSGLVKLVIRGTQIRTPGGASLLVQGVALGGLLALWGLSAGAVSLWTGRGVIRALCADAAGHIPGAALIASVEQLAHFFPAGNPFPHVAPVTTMLVLVVLAGKSLVAVRLVRTPGLVEARSAALARRGATVLVRVRGGVSAGLGAALTALAQLLPRRARTGEQPGLAAALRDGDPRLTDSVFAGLRGRHRVVIERSQVEGNAPKLPGVPRRVTALQSRRAATRDEYTRSTDPFFGRLRARHGLAAAGHREPLPEPRSVQRLAHQRAATDVNVRPAPASTRPALRQRPDPAWFRPHWPVAVIGGFAAVLGGLLAFRLNYEPLWQDEIASIGAAQGMRAHLIPQLPSGFIYWKGELYSALIAVVGKITGDVAADLRAITVVWYVATVLAFGLFLLPTIMGRRWRWFQIGLTIIFATAPIELTWARDVRMYQQAQFFTVLFIAFFFLALRRSSTRNIVLAAVAMVAMYLSHEETFVFLPAVPVVFLAVRRLTWIRDWRWWVFGGGALAIILGQYALATFTHPAYFGFDHSNKPYVLFDPNNFYYYLRQVYFPVKVGGGTMIVISSLSVLASVVGVIRRSFTRLYLTAFLWIPVLMLSTVFSPKVSRYVFITLPVVFILGGLGAADLLHLLRRCLTPVRASLREARLTAAMVTAAIIPGFLWIMLSLSSSASSYGVFAAQLIGAPTVRHHVDYDVTVGAIVHEIKPGDTIITLAPPNLAAYYLGRSPDYIIATGRDKLLYLMERNGQVVDTTFGAPQIFTAADLERVMGSHRKIWLVTDQGPYFNGVDKAISKLILGQYQEVSEGAGAAVYTWGA